MNATTIKKIEIGTEKAEKVVKNLKRSGKKAIFSWKFTLLSILIGMGISLTLVFIAWMRISAWYDKNKVSFRPPVIVRTPVVIEERKVQSATSSAIASSRPIVVSNLPIINELYRKVSLKESRNGNDKTDLLDLHNYCQSIGKVNTIGWRPSENIRLKINFCFNDYAEEFNTFKEVFEERLKTMTTNEALCLHRFGKKQPMCSYSMEIDAIK